MKRKRSIDEALSAAKAMRKQVTPTATPPESAHEIESHLTVVDSSAAQASQTIGSDAPALREDVDETDTLPLTPKPIWVRHTIGLHDTTSLDLRDAADQQKRKERRGQLRPGEPANEQEIADLGIRIALKQLGFSSE